MANDFAKQIDVFFENVVMGFDALNLTAKNTTLFDPGSSSLALSQQTIYRPMPMMTEIVDGRDVSSSYNDLTELMVPSTLTDAHLRNIPVQFTGVDLNDPRQMDNLVDTTNRMLSNKVDTLVADKIALEGTLVATSSTNIDSYDEAAEADALMLEQQATSGARCMLLNPRMAKNMLGDLAGRQTLQGTTLNAYERSAMPPVAGFDTYRTDYGTTIQGSTSTGVTVAGAGQNYTPQALDANGVPVDNRYGTLTVSPAHGLAAGDCFNLADVYAVGHVNKQQTGQLKTFRVISVSGDDLTISPPIIPADGANQSQKDYANVNTTPANGAALTVLNTVTKAASVFYEKSAVEITHSRYNTEPFRATGKYVREATTDSGITIVMLSDSDVGTLVATHRMFVWCNPNIVQPEQAGILLEAQT